VLRRRLANKCFISPIGGRIATQLKRGAILLGVTVVYNLREKVSSEEDRGQKEIRVDIMIKDR